MKQASCAFQFVCKHIELKQAIFLELWVLQRFKTAKVTFSITQGHAIDRPYNRPHMTSYSTSTETMHLSCIVFAL